jgi:hypothetical protein
MTESKEEAMSDELRADMTAALDDVLPVYRHRERLAMQIAAAPEVVWGALHA